MPKANIWEIHGYNLKPSALVEASSAAFEAKLSKQMSEHSAAARSVSVLQGRHGHVTAKRLGAPSRLLTCG